MSTATTDLAHGANTATQDELWDLPPAERTSLVELLFLFDGRAGIRAFWLAQLGLFVGYVIGFQALAWKNTRGFSDEALIVEGLLVVAWFGSYWIRGAVSAKRFHDMGRSGFWALLHAVPVFGDLIVLLWGGVARGQPRANRFGVQPRW